MFECFSLLMFCMCMIICCNITPQGGVGALFNGFGRLFWGAVCDRIGFKLSFIILTVFQAVLHAFYPFSTAAKVGLYYKVLVIYV